MTQDLSYSLTRTAKGLPVSVNSRIDMDAYPEMIFGWCLLRILHLIVSLRLHFHTLESSSQNMSTATPIVAWLIVQVRQLKRLQSPPGWHS